MRYPTGSSNKDFLDNWYDAQPFGSKTSYGYHEGHDYNQKTGGDTDLGQPLYAVADGKIVYYHNASHATTGFGRHMVLECMTSRGKRWYHYCHCQEMTSQVKDVKEGDVIGKLGKSGTTAAHLHFSVFKVDPSTLYKGIDSIAANSSNLNAWWEKFELLNTTQSEEQICIPKTKFEELVSKSTWYDERYQDYQDLVTKKTDFTQFKKTIEQRLETLSANLGTIIDWDEVINASARFKQMDEKNLELQAKLEKEAESNKLVVSGYEKKLSDLKLEMSQMKDDYEKKIDNIEARVDKEIADLQKAKEQYETTNRFISWVKKLLGK